MQLKMTNNIKEATLITHDGKFHPDDVFSTAFLTKYYGSGILYRTSNIDGASKGATIYDVGFTKFDHHGQNPEKRTEKITYSSFGLLWREYGKDFLRKNNYTNIEKLFKGIDETLVTQIDAIDNGYFPKIVCEYNLLDLDKIIDQFNKRWYEENNNNENFLRAVDFASIIFDNVLKSEYAKIKAFEECAPFIEKCQGEILYLPKFIPYKDAIFEIQNDIKIIIFPSDRGGYAIKPKTKSKDSYELLVNFPKRLWGLHDEELVKASSIETATFIHKTGFIANAKTLDDATKLATLALTNKE